MHQPFLTDQVHTSIFVVTMAVCEPNILNAFISSRCTVSSVCTRAMGATKRQKSHSRKYLSVVLLRSLFVSPRPVGCHPLPKSNDVTLFRQLTRQISDHDSLFQQARLHANFNDPDNRPPRRNPSASIVFTEQICCNKGFEFRA